MKQLTDEQRDQLKEVLEGTLDSISHGLGAIGLNPDEYDDNEVEGQLLDGHGTIERCGDCGWWVELGEMNDDGLCMQCAPPDDD